MAEEMLCLHFLDLKWIVYDHKNKFGLNVFFVQKAFRYEWLSISV